jgi:hypothetical protein
MIKATGLAFDEEGFGGGGRRKGMENGGKDFDRERGLAGRTG